MENQHRKISGYRELSQAEIDKMNLIKELAEKCGDLVKFLDDMPNADKRWLEIGKTDLQKGFMGLVRSIAKPETF